MTSSQPMVIDHVARLVPEIEAAERALREQGLGVHRGAYHAFMGARSYTMPLVHPQYLELLVIEDRTVAAATVDGQTLLTCESNGTPLVGWAVLVPNLEEIADRVGIAVHDWTLPQPDGTLRGWRSVWAGPELPFFIDYPNNGDRAGRYAAMYEQVRHTVQPTEFVDITVGGDAAELDEWLGEHALPITYAGGPPGVRSVTIRTAAGDQTFQ